MAEAVFKKVVNDQGLSSKFNHVDSCGTANYHVGDHLTRAPFQLAKSMEYPFHTLGDRFIFFLLSFFLRNSKCPVFLQLSKADFEKYDFIFGMDEENIQNIERVRPSASKAVGKGFPSQSLTSSSS